MRIEGNIIEVFETWPLQVSVETAEGRYHVGLQLGMKITYQGRPVNEDMLKPSRRIRIDGEASGPNALAANWIDILR